MALPNPFLSALIPALRPTGVELADFSFNNSATNLGDPFLNVAVRRWNAVIRIGLDLVTFVAVNPSWQDAPQLVELFDQVAGEIRRIIGAGSLYQESSLSFHLTPGEFDFGKATCGLVRTEVVGEGVFYGLSRYSKDGTLTIDKSLRYEGAAFVRLQRRFPGDASFAEMVAEIYKDEIAALRLLGIAGIP